MTVWETFTEARYFARRNKKLWFCLWLPTTLLAGVAALPVLGLLSRELGHSLMGDSMMKGFDLDFASECFFKLSDAGPFWVGLFVALGAASVFLALLTTGGTLAVLSSGERRFQSSVFFKGCGAHFWKFFRLLIVAAVFYGVLVIGLNALLEWGIRKLTREWTEERYVLLVNWMHYLIVAFVFLWVSMVFDYAKVRLVVDQGRSALAAAYRSIRFVFLHFRKTWGLFLLCTLLGLIFIAVYNPLEQALPQQSRRWVILIFLLQQMFILARIYVRLTFFSSEILLYESLRPSATPAWSATEVSKETPSPSSLGQETGPGTQASV